VELSEEQLEQISSALGVLSSVYREV
jgi:hypothetical protein